MAAPFTFRLARVRELRSQEEDRAREHLAVALRDRATGVEQLDAVRARLHAAHGASTAADGLAPLGGGDLVARQAWLQRLEAGIASAQTELDARDGVVVGRRTELVAAGRRREALDRLHDRRLAEHTTLARRREADELDEIALRAHVRSA